MLPHELDESNAGVFFLLIFFTGRHPCTGMKVAKLEIKVILAFMLAGFEFDVVDKFGERPLELPKPDRNDIHQVRPLGEPCYLQFKRTVE